MRKSIAVAPSFVVFIRDVGGGDFSHRPFQILKYAGFIFNGCYCSGGTAQKIVAGPPVIFNSEMIAFTRFVKKNYLSLRSNFPRNILALERRIKTP